MLFQMCFLGKLQREPAFISPITLFVLRKITCVLKLKTNKHYKQQWGTVFSSMATDLNYKSIHFCGKF